MHLIVPNLVSVMIDFHDDDDDLEVHWSPGRVPLLRECLAASSLL